MFKPIKEEDLSDLLIVFEVIKQEKYLRMVVRFYTSTDNYPVCVKIAFNHPEFNV